jgi:TrmH family RNA methyltransferase
MPTFPSISQPIDRRNHPTIKHIRRLQARTERERTGRYYIEGVRFVAHAVQQHVPIDSLVVCPSLLVHPFAQKLVRRLRKAGVPTLEVTPGVLHSLALVDDPQGMGAVVRQRWLPPEHMRPDQGLCWIAVETVQSPGNLGTILRTSEAVGGAGLILIGDGVDPYDPATVRASMAALFGQQFVRMPAPEFAAWKARHGWLLVGTAPSAAVDYRQVAYRAPTVLLLGGERKGLPPELQALCDVMVHIPMVGQSDSLNVAVAAGVLLYELFNQRREGCGPAAGDGALRGGAGSAAGSSGC